MLYSTTNPVTTSTLVFVLLITSPGTTDMVWQLEMIQVYPKLCIVYD